MELAQNDQRQVLIVPVSFVSDHIETLHELNIEYREVALKSGIEHYEVMPGLNASETFVGALRDVALKALDVKLSERRRPAAYGSEQA